MELQNNARAIKIKMTLGGSGHSRSGGGGSSSLNKNMLKLAICLVLINLLLANLATGQFFTKSSKSIPRMGRRSLPDYKSELEAYQQLLAEEYEQNLINDALEERKQQTMLATDELSRAEREPESADRNQKLSDLFNLRALSSRTARASDEFDAAAAAAAPAPKAMTRNERARPQSFGDRLVAAAAAAAAQQQQEREEAAARMEATRERAW